jgi:hypothetical protein
MSTPAVRRAAPLCHACQRPFTPDVQGHSMLQAVDGEWSRADWCDDCWNGADGRVRPEHVSHWLFRREPPRAKTKHPLMDADFLWALFRDIEDAKHPKRDAFRYLLALALLRKRRLRELREVKRGDVIFLELQRGSDNNERFEIARPAMKEKALMALDAEFRLLLDSPGTFMAPPTTPSPGSDGGGDPA